jgi:hypothetical protein
VRPFASLAFGGVLLLAAAPSAGLEVSAPAEPRSETPMPLVEVRGQAGARPPAGHDVVIAIDLSDSTTAPSGEDLDGDGAGGRSDPARLAAIAQEAGRDSPVVKRLAEVDLEDSVLFAELAAAEILIRRLDPRVFRVGIVAFSNDARIVAPVGARPEVLQRALDSLRRDFWRDLGGTNFAAAIQTSLSALRPDPAPGAPRPGGEAPATGAIGAREADIVLLSDGAPTLPPHGSRPARFSIEAAQDAALLGVRVYPFALGREAESALDVYRAMAAVSGGRFERVDSPGDAIPRLRSVDLADLAELRIENASTGESARAVRTFPDGQFDGFVALQPGPNRIRFTATSVDGSRSEAERVVVYRPEAAQGPEAERIRADQQALLVELRRRTREVELWAEIERGRSLQLRELELEPLGPGSAQ